MTRQPEHVVASTTAEWRSLWSRVGMAAPDVFEPGRMNAVGIFLGRRASEGYSVNILSTSRRRDRIVVVFEERMPAEIMMAQRASPAPRPVAGGPARASAGPPRASRRPAPRASPCAGPCSRPPGRTAHVAVGHRPDPSRRPADLRRTAPLPLATVPQRQRSVGVPRHALGRRDLLIVHRKVEARAARELADELALQLLPRRLALLDVAASTPPCAWPARRRKSGCRRAACRYRP